MNHEEGARGAVDLSVVVPFYNEEENVEPLYRDLTRVIASTGKSYELVFIDDGSSDGTFPVLERLCREDPRVAAIRLRRNFGQTAALAAGFDYAAGDVIISMDGDLQHDPAEIPAFLSKMEEGYDIVSGWRQRRVDNLITRKIPSWIANRMMGLLSGVDIHDFGTTYKAYRREVIKGIDLYGEMHRFVPALASRMGVNIVEIPIRNIMRKSGRSNYGLSRTTGVLLDLIAVKFFISYLPNPMRIFGSCGLLSFALGISLAVGLLLWALVTGLNIAQHHEGMLILSVLAMLMGVQFITLGLLGEVLSRIYHKIEGKHSYVIRDIRSRRRGEGGGR